MSQTRPPAGWPTQPPPPVVPPPPTTQPPGWYPDPWRTATWRWWDGHSWSSHVHVRADPARKPRLPAFLSPPVVIGALVGVPSIAIAAVLVPIAIALGFVPLLIVGPVLIWIDRLEPEPRSERTHAFLWGAFVAGSVSLVVNTAVALTTGSDAVAAVASAPIIEEITKVLAIVWAVRRKQVDGIMDGLVYAGWSALGFAIVENFVFFFEAEGDDVLLETFVARALMSPFLHPLLTAWSGVAIGIAVRNRRPLTTAWWGLVGSIVLHSLWNASLFAAEFDGGVAVTLTVVVAFVAMFSLTIVGVLVLRRRDADRFARFAPWIAQRYGLPLERVLVMTNPRERRLRRKQVARGERRAFDSEVHALARLVLLFDHPTPPDPADEARLLGELYAAMEGRAT